MRNISRTFVVVTLVAVAAAMSACNSCGTPPGEGEGEGAAGEGEGAAGGEGEGTLPVTADARELCETWTRGELVTVLSFAQGLAATQQRCVAAEAAPPDPTTFASAAQQECADDTNPVVQAFAEAIAGGRVTFHLDAIRACSALTLTQLQTQTPTLPGGCDLATLFTSNQHEGDACKQDWDCPDGTHCEADPLDASGLTCLAPAAVGDPCADSQAVSDAAFASLGVRTCGTDAVCSSNVCVAKLDVGGDCGTGTCLDTLRCDRTLTPETCVAKSGVGDPCAADDDCDDPDARCAPNGTCVLGVADAGSCAAGNSACSTTCFVCRPAAGGGAQCQDRAVAGGGCNSLDDCAHNFVCDVGNHVCIAGAATGEPCVDAQDCLSGDVCGADGTCVVQPDIGGACSDATTTECKTGTCNQTTCVNGNVGDACGTFDSVCNTGLLCRASDHTCQEAPTAGPCSASSACAAGFICDTTTTTCGPLPVAGQTCAPGDKCAPGTFCDTTATCQTQKDAGSTCTESLECKTSCINGTCTAAGASCTSSKSFFPLFVILSIALPMRRLRLRLRKR